MKTVCIVQVLSETGEQWFYAGADRPDDALIMAAERGLTGDGVTAKMVNNREAVGPGEWRFIPTGL